MTLPLRAPALLRTRSGTALLTLLLALASLLLSTPSHAEAWQRRARDTQKAPRLATSPEPGRYLLLGVNLGLTGLPGTDGALFADEVWKAVGFEASAVKLPGADFWWFGGYVDFVQVLPNRASRLSLGPELGWGPVGVDAGLLGEYSGRTGKFNAGLQARGMLTLGVLGIYLGAPCLYDADAHALRMHVQAGLVLKVPVFMGE